MPPDPISGHFGQAIMSGWVSDDPRNGLDIAFIYLGTPADGSTGAPAEVTMPLVAQALGLDPTPGAVTGQVTAGTRLHVGGDGWLTLHAPNGQTWQHPGGALIRQVARQRGEAVLAISYLPMRSGQGADEHCDASVAANAVTLGLIPVRAA